VFEPISSLPDGPFVQIHIDGRATRVRAGISLAVALMEAGIVALRQTEISSAPRAPLCLMGVCFECLCEVDGCQNVQACMTAVADGMHVTLARGARRMDGKT
jgi:predicted molibdopterin-dependent oxidoreductase YjgC